MATGPDALTGRRVGELAAATGLTVRTLHYHEEIGLLVPSARSPAGHRVYSAADVERLYRICFLRRMGLPLGEIARVFDDPSWSLRAAMTEHVAYLDRRLEAERQLRARLGRLIPTADILDEAAADELLELLRT